MWTTGSEIRQTLEKYMKEFFSEKNKNKREREKQTLWKLRNRVQAMVVALPFRYDLWSSSEPVREEDFIDVHFLIPNGNYVNFKCRSKTTLFELKEVLGVKAANRWIMQLGQKNTKITLNASLSFVCFLVIILLTFRDVIKFIFMCLSFIPFLRNF